MKILLLAPHPFYQNRGTPIAVDLLISSLCAAGHTVDLLTFNEGEDRHYQNLSIHRVGERLGLKNINPGFSIKKVFLDLAMLPRMVELFRRNQYDIVHAVEESVFLAWFFHIFNKVPFIYDMDSSLVTQMTDKMAFLRPLSGLLRWLESIPIRKSLLVIPVCDALAELSLRYRDSGVYLLKDVSMLDTSPADRLPEPVREQITNFQELFDSPKKILFYAGNLESYQGIDLMLESFALAVTVHQDLALVVVGGNDADISFYRGKARDLGLDASVRFLGPRPIALLGSLCSQSQLLLSPRITGENTPMKLYSYLDSGVPVLATDLPTHTEVIDREIGYLARPEPQAFSSAIVTIFDDLGAAGKKAVKARQFIAENHSREVFADKVEEIYAKVASELGLASSPGHGA